MFVRAAYLAGPSVISATAAAIGLKCRHPAAAVPLDLGALATTCGCFGSTVRFLGATIVTWHSMRTDCLPSSSDRRRFRWHWLTLRHCHYRRDDDDRHRDGNGGGDDRPVDDGGHHDDGGENCAAEAGEIHQPPPPGLVPVRSEEHDLLDGCLGGFDYLRGPPRSV